MRLSHVLHKVSGVEARTEHIDNAEHAAVLRILSRPLWPANRDSAVVNLCERSKQTKMS